MKTEQQLRREIGARILRAMKASSKYRTRGALAEAIGTSNATVSRIVNGTIDPGVTLLIRIAQAYEVGIDKLMPVDDFKEPADYDLCLRELRKKEILIKNALKILGGASAWHCEPIN